MPPGEESPLPVEPLKVGVSVPTSTCRSLTGPVVFLSHNVQVTVTPGNSGATGPELVTASGLAELPSGPMEPPCDWPGVLARIPDPSPAIIVLFLQPGLDNAPFSFYLSPLYSGLRSGC